MVKAYHGSPHDFNLAGETVDGRLVRRDIPNTSSIGASLGNEGDYQVVRGVREVPLSAFTLDESPIPRDARTINLAREIQESGEINPLIVALDAKGPYILEGGHRYDALRFLGAKSFPALVVREGVRSSAGSSRMGILPYLTAAAGAGLTGAALTVHR